MNWWVKSTKKVCITSDYTEQFLILASANTGCISISALSTLNGILIGCTSCAIGIKVRVIAAGIKKYVSQWLRKRSMIK